LEELGANLQSFREDLQSAGVDDEEIEALIDCLRALGIEIS
jgi:hypothetical protein